MHADFKIVWAKPWVPRVLCAFFSVLILLSVAVGLHAFFSSDTLLAEQSLEEVTLETPAPLDRSVVLKMPFFGDFIPDDVTGAGVKRSPLQLSVVGIIYSPQEAESQVIIQMPDKQEQIFYVGDPLPGGAILKRILPDEVFMIRNGTVESLSLPEKGLTFDAPAKPLGDE